ncbi:MAG TPA: hypothetical protein VF771_14315 [Longimicrobiaceae bacterium]
MGAAYRVNFHVNREIQGQVGQHGGAQAPNPLSERVQLAQIVARLAELRKRESVRTAAAQVGISKSALDGLVRAYNEGRSMPQPHPKNWEKLKAWYLAQKQNEPDATDSPVDSALLALHFVADFPEAEQRVAAREMVALFREFYEGHDRPVPAWIARLSSALGEDGEPQGK